MNIQMIIIIALIAFIAGLVMGVWLTRPQVIR